MKRASKQAMARKMPRDDSVYHWMYDINQFSHFHNHSSILLQQTKSSRTQVVNGERKFQNKARKSGNHVPCAKRKKKCEVKLDNLKLN